MNDFVILSFQLLDELQPIKGAVEVCRGDFISSLKLNPEAVGVIPVNTKVGGVRHTAAIRRAGCANLLIGMMKEGGEPDWKAAFLNAGGDQIIPRDTPRELFDHVVDALRRRDRSRDRQDIEFSGFRLEAGTGMLFFGSRPVPLSPLQRKLIRLLVDNKGRPVDIGKLAREFESTTRSTRQIITQTRRKIRASSGGRDFIVSRWGEGYCFLPTGYRPKITISRNGDNYTRPISRLYPFEAAE